MKRLLSLVLLASIAGCAERVDLIGPSETDPALSRSGPGAPTSATMRFGDPRAGSPFHPEEQHDASIHAADKMVPRTVTIPVGGTVTLEVAPSHIVAIYEPGTQPSDIEVSPATLEDLVVPFPPFLLPGFVINDPEGRLAFQGPADAFSDRIFQHTFTEPGRYLVICAFTPHFIEADMFGWVIVR